MNWLFNFEKVSVLSHIPYYNAAPLCVRSQLLLIHYPSESSSKRAASAIAISAAIPAIA
jgi:hypothetical protein